MRKYVKRDFDSVKQTDFDLWYFYFTFCSMSCGWACTPTYFFGLTLVLLIKLEIKQVGKQGLLILSPKWLIKTTITKQFFPEDDKFKKKLYDLHSDAPSDLSETFWFFFVFCFCFWGKYEVNKWNNRFSHIKGSSSG